VLSVVVFLLVLGLSRPRAGEGMFSFGLRTQGTIDFAPGNDYFNGFQLGYSNYYLFAHRLELKASYLTTRIEAAYREVLKYDLYLFSPTWHLRRNAIFDPTVQADLGYAYLDPEFGIFEDHLGGWAGIVSLQPGLNINLFGGEYGIHYHLGWQFNTPTGHEIYPLTFGLGVWKML
jgi:hypothetical protein